MPQNGAQMNNGFNDSAYVRGLGGGDLGIPYRRTHDNTWGYVYGDSWSGIGQSGFYLGSPEVLCQSSFDSTGNTPISFTWALPNGTAAQVMPYNHWADNGHRFEVSRIPNDCVEVGTRTYMQCTSVKSWGTDQQDGVNLGMLCYSDDYGVNWNIGPCWLGEDFGGRSPFVQWSFAEQDATYMYIVSNRWNGSHNNNVSNGPILLRVKKNDMLNQSATNYQNWSGTAWVNGDQPAAELFSAAGENLCEHSVKKIGSTYVMSYLSTTGGGIYTRTASALTGPWSARKLQVSGAQWSQIYGGYIHPGSPSTANLHLIVSQWNTSTNNPYRCLQFSGKSA